MVHRARQRLVEQRTATVNRIRGLLAEIGVVLPPKTATFGAAPPRRWGNCRA
ncbi:hypothetical protein [Pseudaquabacterium terrae]|uniref:hypothetical protein n=1 Tax=Pseudaquabacterium terrae TaxID=2732868 RepID=UPI001FE8B8E1|nr:hypothetical protein [Aquabacterium terrae]